MKNSNYSTPGIFLRTEWDNVLKRQSLKQKLVVSLYIWQSQKKKVNWPIRAVFPFYLDQSIVRKQLIQAKQQRLPTYTATVAFLTLSLFGN